MILVTFMQTEGAYALCVSYIILYVLHERRNHIFDRNHFGVYKPPACFSARSFLLGSTCLATVLYLCIARTHKQIAVQALEAFSICFASKSGLTTNGSIACSHSTDWKNWNRGVLAIARAKGRAKQLTLIKPSRK